MARERSKAGTDWRLWLTGAGGVAVFVLVAVAAIHGYVFALVCPQFRLSLDRREALTVTGMKNASPARVVRVFDVDFGRSIFTVPLAERRRRLLAIDWVEDASVSRIWPNRLVVRITERKPVAFVNLPQTIGGRRLLLIDRAGVLLEPPPQSRFAFPVLSGIRETQSEAERRVRVQACCGSWKTWGRRRGRFRR